MPPPPAELFATRIFLGPALRAQPDGRLVGLVREGYDSAFEEIVRRYRGPLERFAAGIVGGRGEDVIQDSFSKALLALRNSEAEIELRPWLYRIVRNTALNDLRDRGPAPEQLSEALAGAGSVAVAAERREELADLIKRLAALPEPQRAAIVMRELEGLSHEQIATALGLSGGAARQAIYRARAALREGLGLVVPLPVVRTLIEHGGDVALGGLGVGGTVKLGAATLLVAGTVGAGISIEHHQGDRPSPEAAEAAPLVRGGGHGSPPASAGAGPGGASGVSGSSEDRSGRSGDDRGGHSGSGSGSIEEGHHRGGEIGDDDSGPGSGSDRSGDEGSPSVSGEDGGLSGGDGVSGSGDSEAAPRLEPTPVEPVIESGGSSGDGGESSGEGSGDLAGTANLDGSP
jgi:RNA polymerase sigma factor (sigma-70 family)